MLKFKTELQPHQIAAVSKLSKIKIAGIYMEQGTGKTRTALELIDMRLSAGKVNYVIWLCPCSVKGTIQREIMKHTDGDFPYRIEGIESLSSSIRLNCELIQLVETKNCYLIVDESNLVKNHRALRTKNITRLAQLCQYKMILNGTPISKNEKDLFAQWYLLDWRILGYQSFWSFAANHLEYDEKIPGRIRRVFNVDYLVRKIAPYTYQVKKEDCLVLPKKKYYQYGFPMQEKQREHYEEIKDIFLFAVDELDSTTLYKLFTALQHVSSGKYVLTGPKQRMKTKLMFNIDDNPRILKTLDYIDDITKTIIWCKYTDEINNLYTVLENKYGAGCAVKFYGEVSKRNREKALYMFENEARFFIANKTCAGYGLNLQFCHDVIYYSNDWDYATRIQSEDRVHRIGQEHDVDIRDIYAWSSLDERILRCLYKKESLVESFKSWIDTMKDAKTNKKDLKNWIDNK